MSNEIENALRDLIDASHDEFGCRVCGNKIPDTEDFGELLNAHGEGCEVIVAMAVLQ